MFFLLGISPEANAEFVRHFISESFGQALFHDTVDFDNDGDFDVLATGRAPGQIVWFENVDMMFTMHVIATASNPSRVAVVDIDEDGDNDVFVSFDISQDSYEWWENSGDNSSFTHHYLDTYAFDARSLDFGDIDMDGDIDVLGAGGGNVTVYWNDGEENFSEDAIAWYNGATAGKLADMDNDEDLDIVCPAFNEDEMGLWYNDGNGNFSFFSVGYIDDPHWTDIVDLDNDGDLDILSTDTNHGYLYYFKNNGGSFNSQVITTSLSGPRGVVGGDFDNDEDMDIAVCNYYGDNVTLLTNDGNEVFSSSIIDANLNGASDLEALDFDFDNDLDLTSTAFHADYVVWYENPIAEPVSLQVTPESDPVIIPGNGGSFTYDVVVANTLDGRVSGNIWAVMVDPEGIESIVSPVFSLTVFANQERQFNNIIQIISGDLPAGEYIYRICAGYYPEVMFSDEFGLIKQLMTNTNDGTYYDWDIIGFDNDGTLTEDSNPTELLSEFTVSSAYPNPFNPSTSISVTLPEASQLSIVVYDISGRRVAELCEGTVSAGLHSFEWHATTMSSGVYMIRAIVPGKMDQVQKLLLIQ